MYTPGYEEQNTAGSFYPDYREHQESHRLESSRKSPRKTPPGSESGGCFFHYPRESPPLHFNIHVYTLSTFLFLNDLCRSCDLSPSLPSHSLEAFPDFHNLHIQNTRLSILKQVFYYLRIVIYHGQKAGCGTSWYISIRFPRLDRFFPDSKSVRQIKLAQFRHFPDHPYVIGLKTAGSDKAFFTSGRFL